MQPEALSTAIQRQWSDDRSPIDYTQPELLEQIIAYLAGEENTLPDDMRSFIDALQSPPPAPPDPSPDWEGLKGALRGSDIFLKAFGTANQNAWSLLLATLNSNSSPDDAGRLTDFQMAIAGIRQGLAADLTPTELTTLNGVLADNHFDIEVT